MTKNKTETKICKHCQSEISVKAKICPVCKKKQKKNIIIPIIAILFALGIIGAIFNGGEEKNETNNTPSAVNSAPQPTTEVEVIQITAQELLDAYDENGVKADDMYKGKLLEITGTVKNIDKDIMDNVYITMNEEQYSIISVQCYFNDKDEINKVMDIQKDTTITVIGTGDGGTLNVAVKDCKIK